MDFPERASQEEPDKDVDMNPAFRSVDMGNSGEQQCDSHMRCNIRRPMTWWNKGRERMLESMMDGWLERISSHGVEYKADRMYEYISTHSWPRVASLLMGLSWQVGRQIGSYLNTTHYRVSISSYGLAQVYCITSFF